MTEQLPELPPALRRRLNRIAAGVTRDYLRPALREAGVTDAERYHLRVDVTPVAMAPAAAPAQPELPALASCPFCAHVEHLSEEDPDSGFDEMLKHVRLNHPTRDQSPGDLWPRIKHTPYRAG